jgi:hypothetical protein
VDVEDAVFVRGADERLLAVFVAFGLSNSRFDSRDTRDGYSASRSRRPAEKSRALRVGERVQRVDRCSMLTKECMKSPSVKRGHEVQAMINLQEVENLGS